MITIQRTIDGLSVIHLPGILVNWDLPWKNAVRSAAPNVLASSNIWEAEKQFNKPGGKKGLESADISLLSFGSGWWKSEDALGYNLRRDLPAAEPQHIFAVGKAFPTLNAVLNRDSFSIVSLKECILREHPHYPLLWYIGEERGADANWSTTDGFDGRFWFAVLGLVS